MRAETKLYGSYINFCRGSAAMEKVVLAVQGLNKKIKDRHIIKDLSFKKREGEVCGFIGANGAVKTTTMRMLLRSN